eukprot:13993008-Alexandrium_andersonii.AAC.1
MLGGVREVERKARPIRPRGMPTGRLRSWPGLLESRSAELTDCSLWLTESALPPTRARKIGR